MKFRRKLRLVLSGMICAASLATATLNAKAASGETETASMTDVYEEFAVETQVTYSDGRTMTVDQLLSAEQAETEDEADQPAAYTVLFEGEEILQVETHTVFAPEGSTVKEMNRYYAVSFLLPGTNKECFLTGLSAGTVDDICERLCASYEQGSDFYLNSLDIIDAEKRYETTGGDDELCWAAASSNMLQYTGWGLAAGFQSEDALLDYFQKYYIDDGFNARSGLNWFFNGSTFDTEDNQRTMTNYPAGGGLLPDYYARNIVKNMSFDDNWELTVESMIEDLKSGYGINVNVAWWDGEEFGGAHALTLWGVILNNDYPKGTKEHYDAIIVADSDNQRPKSWTTDRSVMANSLDVYGLQSIKVDLLGLDSFLMYDESGVLANYTSLKPYSEDITKETAEAATKNVHETADLTISDLAYSYQPGEDSSQELLSGLFAGDVYLIPTLQNASDVSLSYDTPVYASLVNAAGETVAEWDEVWSLSLKPNEEIENKSFFVKGLSAGTYTFTMEVNKDRALTESYYVNNSFVRTFTVLPCEDDLNSFRVEASVEMAVDEASSDDADDDDDSEEDDEYYDVTLSYPGLSDSELLRRADEYRLRVFFAEGDQWNIYPSKAIIFDKGDDQGIPKHIRIMACGDKLRFGVFVKKDGVCYNFFSDETYLKTGLVIAKVTENSTKRFTAIERTAASLNEGEQFAFVIENRYKNGPDEITGSYTVFAEQEDGTRTDLTTPVSFTVKKGETTEEIQFSAWNADVILPENGTLMLELSYEVNGETVKSLCELGALPIRESASANVDLKEDVVDEFDGHTSFREAVLYANEHPGTTVTFAGDVNSVMLDSPIELTGKLTINEAAGQNAGIKKYINVLSKGSTSFVCEKGAVLTLNHLVFAQNKLSEFGGAVYAKDAELVLNDCCFNSCSATKRGGALYVDGGKALIKNTSFLACSAPFGGLLCINNQAKVEMLNCVSTGASYNYGAIYNNAGSLNIINCTILKSKCSGIGEDTGAITGNSHTNVINSVIVSDGAGDIGEDVNVFASAVGTVASEDQLDALTKYGWNTEMLVFFTGENMLFDISLERPHLLPRMRYAAAAGYLTTVSNGQIYVSDGSKKKTATGVKTSFTNKELGLDITGSTRPAYYGAYTSSKIGLKDAKATAKLSASVTYTGKKCTPAVTVTVGNKTLKKGTDYKVTYSNNVSVGKATVKISGIGDYNGTITKTFKINPKPVSLSSVTAGIRRFAAKWSKGVAKQTTGYQLQYSNKADFSSGCKTFTVKKLSTVSKVVTGLAKGTYYVRVRTYKTVAKVNYYSSWSAKKKVVVK